MHEEIPFQSLHSKQIQALEPESRSSLENISTPLVQNHLYEQLQHNFQNNIPILFNNQQMHDLITAQQRIYEPQFKQSIEKYVSMVMHLNNIAHFFICKLENKEKRATEMHQNILNTNSRDSPNPHRPENSLANFSPHPFLTTANSDKLEIQILMMLNEAERILQYAASCGKNIDRKLIICVLNNQACFFQKIWELQKSCSYIEAAIINLQQWGQQSNWSQISSSNSVTVNSIYSNHPMIMRAGFNHFQEDIILMNMRRQRLPKSEGQFSTKVELGGGDEQKQKLAKNYELAPTNKNNKGFKQTCSSPALNQSIDHASSSLVKRDRELVHHMKKLLQLSIYYLQYTSLCGQLNFHDRAIENAKKVITKIKKILQINRKYYINYEQTKSEYYPNSFIISEANDEYDDQIQIDVKKMIFGLSEIGEEMPEQINDAAVENYRQAVRYYLKQYESVHSRESRKISVCEKELNKEKIDKKLLKLHKNLTGLNEQAAQKYLQKGYKYQDYIQMVKIKQQVQAFTISDILQIRSKNYKYWPAENERISVFSKNSNKDQDSGQYKEKPKYMNIKKEKNSIFKYLPDYLFSQSVHNSPNKPEEHHLNYEIRKDNILFNLDSIGHTAGFPFLFTAAILFATSYFVLATELRLQAAKDEVKEGDRFEKKIYKQSEIYHLMAILILVIYVPLDMTYLRHIVSSYENYYVNQISPIDEMMSNEYGNGPTRQKKLSYSNIALRSKLDKEGIYKYPKAESRKQKELITSMKKAINKQMAIELKTEQKPIIFPKLSKKNTLNQLEAQKQTFFKIAQNNEKVRNNLEDQQGEEERFDDSQEYSNSQDKIYDSLFDLQKRKKMKRQEMKKNSQKQQDSLKRSKSNSRKKQNIRSKNGDNFEENSEDAYGRRNNHKQFKEGHSKKFIKKIETHIHIRSSKGSNYRVPYSATAMPSPQKINSMKQFRKMQFSSPKNKIDKSGSKSIHSKHIQVISQSISVIPSKAPNVHSARKAGTNKNSLLQNKFPEKGSGMTFEKEKQKQRKRSSKIFKSPREKKPKYNKISEYRLNTERNAKASKQHRNQQSNFKSKQKNMTKSKSKSNDKIKKRTTHQKIHEKKEIVIETDDKKDETDKVRRGSEKVYENNSNDYKNIYFEVQENDPDVYHINVNKNSINKNCKKPKKLKQKQKEKRGSSRVCSPSSKNNIAKCCKTGKQSPKVITNYSSNLTTTPNSISNKNQTGSTRKIAAIN